MADIYGSHFEFSGISSRQYSLILASVNTSRITQKAGSVESITIFNKSEKRKYLIDTDYVNSPLSFDVEIITDNDRLLEVGERRTIEKWLFNRKDYRKLYLDLADDLTGETYEYIDGKRIRYYLNCRFINPEKLEYNGGIVGYKATLETDMGWAWTDTITKKYLVNNGASDISSVISVNVDTDIDDYIYPKLTIQMGSEGGDIIITNNTDDTNRLTKFVSVSPEASIIMKGELNYISGQYYEKFALRNFVRLLDGENKLTILGDVSSIEVEYSARRML